MVHRSATPPFRLIVAQPGDLDALVAIRIEAMRESLERVGRFDPVRARERFASSFAAPDTRHIVVGEERAGFVVVKDQPPELMLDHLYLRPLWQRRGLGAAVLAQVFAEADARGLAVRVGALKQSDANRFYAQHGFARVAEGEYDIYYRREPAHAA